MAPSNSIEDDEVPTGMPDEEPNESDPLGVPEADPEGEGDTPRGADHMPGIATDGEPPSSS